MTTKITVQKTVICRHAWVEAVPAGILKEGERYTILKTATICGEAVYTVKAETGEIVRCPAIFFKGS